MTRNFLKLVLVLPVIGFALGIYTLVQFIQDVGRISGSPAVPIVAANFASSAPHTDSALPVNTVPPLLRANIAPAVLPPMQAPIKTRASVSSRANITAVSHHPISDMQSAAMTQRDAAARDAASSYDTNVRRDAIQSLAQFRTPENIYTLSQTLHDTDTQNRYLSVESLRLLGVNTGDPDGSILTLLRNAAFDNDPTVANHARQAMAELAESSP